MDYQRIFEFDFGIQKIRYRGSQGQGLCPFHDDQNPSLSWSTKSGLWTCFSGCGSGNTYQFAERLNLPNPTQYIEESIVDSKNGRTNGYESNTMLKMENKQVLEVDKMVELEKLKNRYRNQVKKISAYIEKWKHKYLGLDDDGRTVFIYPEAIKHHKSTDGRMPWWEGQKDKDEKVIGAHCQIFAEDSIQRYNKERPLIIYEGEKDWSISSVQGITFSGGCGKIPDDISSILGFPEIIICYDNDEAGTKGAEKVAERIKKESPETTVKIAKWDEPLPKGYDVCVDAVKKEPFWYFDKALSDATEYTPSVEGTKVEEKDKKGFEVMNAKQLMQKFNNPPKYIVEHFLIESGVSLIAGTDGVGKSWLGLQMAICIASGKEFLGFKVNRRPVLVIQFELSSEQLTDRLRKLDLSDTDDYLDFVILKDDDLIFTDAWKKVGNTINDRNFIYGVVIVDNLYTSTNKDVSKNQDLKPLLLQIDFLKRTTGNAFVLMGHHNKNDGNEPILTKNIITGGKTLTNYVSNVFQLGTSTMGADLRRGKITKVRDSYTELQNEPLLLSFDFDSKTFHYENVIHLERLHCEEISKRWEYTVLIDFTERNPDNPDFVRQKIELFIQGTFPDDEPSNVSQKTTRWLKKMDEFGFIRKKKYNSYQLKYDAIRNLNIDD